MTKKRTKLIFRGVCCLAAMAFVQEQSQAQSIVMANNQPAGQQQNRSELKKTVLLTEVLQDLQAEYHVSFLYEKKNLEGKYISAFPAAFSDKIENTLGKLLPAAELTYEKINDKTYAILTNDNSGTQPEKLAGMNETEKLNYFNILFVDYNKNKRPDVITYRAKTAPVWQITGKVVSATGEALPGVTVLLKGTSTGNTTGPDGTFTLSVPEAPGTLVFSFIGFTSQEKAFTGPGAINVTLAEDATALQEVVVTGYTTERKRDIIGAVAVVKPEELLSTPAANLTSQLQGRASGVTVSGSGQPGGAAKVRIRGFASFGNNDPLYVIDGVPTSDPTQLNPQDIESMQVLKDATSASIYGARAANGVIIITTKQGKSGTVKIGLDSYYGTQVIPESTFPEMLNTAQYGEYFYRSAAGAGQAIGTVGPDGKVYGSTIYGSGTSPVIPDYFIVSGKNKGNFKGPVMEGDPRINLDPEYYSSNILDPDNYYQLVRVSPGTNWFKEVTRPARIQSHQLSASGGTEKGSFALGLNYFDQEGVFLYTGYKRMTVRANTMFKPYKNIRVGENLQISYDTRKGGDQTGQDGAWAGAYRMSPYIPVYDVFGGFAGNNIGESGNGSNPVATLFRNKDDKNQSYKIFGNVFAEVDLFKNFTARTSFGLDYTNRFETDYSAIIGEQSEPKTSDNYTERSGYIYSWTWTNTLQYQKMLGEDHSIKGLVGIEAIDGIGRRIVGQQFDFPFGSDPNFRSLNTGIGTPFLTEDVGNEYAPQSIYSQFVRADYAFRDKYLFNATVRRDGSSKFGSENRYGVFPAIGLGWRISGESFMQNIPWITDLKLRGGWGQMGSMKNVNAANAYSFYEAGRANSWYDISGASNGATLGFTPSRLGNTSSKWEATETTNIGIDGSFLDGKLDASFEVYNIATKDLLVTRQANPFERTAVAQPSLNVGTMRNRGFDLSLTTRGDLPAGLRYEGTFTFTHYTNEVTKLDNSGSAVFDVNAQRSGTVTRTTAGHPISSFYGYQLDGFFDNEDEITASPTQSYAEVGAWKIKNQNTDNVINADDRTFLGSPIPDFQTGLNLSLGYKNFDLSAFLFWNYGNEIYNFTKYFTDLRGFIGGVSTRALTDSWTPTNMNAKLPILNKNDATSNGLSTDYYIESGSYLRLRNLQVGYNLPQAAASKFRLSNLRVYVQGQNLFTATKYTGADPDISIQTSAGAPGDRQDLLLGVDQGSFPNTRQFILGLNVGF